MAKRCRHAAAIRSPEAALKRVISYRIGSPSQIGNMEVFLDNSNNVIDFKLLRVRGLEYVIRSPKEQVAVQA